MESINQYDVIEITEDINPKVKRGMQGAILEKYNEDDFEIEILDKEGVNISFGNQFTFTVNRRQ
ncbi:DUF4926 domain-containing protein [Pseudochryseolinea flava]|nr:DUF4926 domain-containing protein [Pseudochryseolinea flava]